MLTRMEASDSESGARGALRARARRPGARHGEARIMTAGPGAAGPGPGPGPGTGAGPLTSVWEMNGPGLLVQIMIRPGTIY